MSTRTHNSARAKVFDERYSANYDLLWGEVCKRIVLYNPRFLPENMRLLITAAQDSLRKSALRLNMGRPGMAPDTSRRLAGLNFRDLNAIGETASGHKHVERQLRGLGAILQSKDLVIPRTIEGVNEVLRQRTEEILESVLVLNKHLRELLAAGPIIDVADGGAHRRIDARLARALLALIRTVLEFVDEIMERANAEMRTLAGRVTREFPDTTHLKMRPPALMPAEPPIEQPPKRPIELPPKPPLLRNAQAPTPVPAHSLVTPWFAV